MSEYRALIGAVAYSLDKVPLSYQKALERAGARIRIVSPAETRDAQEALDALDGLLLIGGRDVDPARYGGTPSADGGDPERDHLEIDLISAADRSRVPTLAICRGMQVMNVAFGGSLHTHLPELDWTGRHGVPGGIEQHMHDIRVVPQTRLWSTTKSSVLTCSCHHRQGVDRIGEGLIATAHASDGLIEALERDVPLDDISQTWMLGVQWHPEDTANTDELQQSLFDAFVNLARLRGSRAAPGEAGGPSRPFAVSEPDPAWPARFEEEARLIRGALDVVATRIEHVGSTAVPGLAAKPIIDIQVSVRSMEPRSAYVRPLKELGYDHVPDPIGPDHEYFKKDLEGVRLVQIHLCLEGSDWERRHLAFRDWLRSHPEDAAAYADLKRNLAAAHRRDIMSYVDAKTPFIRAIEERALGSVQAGSTKGTSQPGSGTG